MKVYTFIAQMMKYQNRSTLIAYANPNYDEILALAQEISHHNDYSVRILDGREKNLQDRDNNIMVCSGHSVVHSYMRELGSQKFDPDWGRRAVDYVLFYYPHKGMTNWSMHGAINIAEDADYPNGSSPVAYSSRVAKDHSRRLDTFLEDIKPVAKQAIDRAYQRSLMSSSILKKPIRNAKMVKTRK